MMRQQYATYLRALYRNYLINSKIASADRQLMLIHFHLQFARTAGAQVRSYVKKEGEENEMRY